MLPTQEPMESSGRKSIRKKGSPPTSPPPSPEEEAEEVLVKYTVECLNKERGEDGMDTIRVRKTYITPSSAWATFEKELKKECHCATIKKIKYTDNDSENIYIVDSQELEAAIFKEGVHKFDILFFKHEIVYTAQYINGDTPDEPNEDIGNRKAFPCLPTSSSTLSNGAWGIFMCTVQEISKNAVIKKIKYTDKYKKVLYIVNAEELEHAIFMEGICKYHILFELEIMYTAQRIDAKKPDKPNKDIGLRKAYPLPSLSSASPTSAWNIFSSTINQIYDNSSIKKIMYTDKGKKDIYIVKSEELEKAIFSEGVAIFHVMYKC